LPGSALVGPLSHLLQYHAYAYALVCPIVPEDLISSWIKFALQVLGLFTVVATATACLYFVDTSGVASQAGIDAAGVLVLLLNAFFLLCMAILIAKAGALDILLKVQDILTKAKKLLQKLWAKVACCGGSRMGRADRNNAATGRPSLEMLQTGRSLSLASRANSTDLLRTGVLSTSLSMQSGRSSNELLPQMNVTVTRSGNLRFDEH